MLHLPTASWTHRNGVPRPSLVFNQALTSLKHQGDNSRIVTWLFFNHIKHSVIQGEDHWTVRYPYDRRRFCAVDAHEGMWTRTVGQFAPRLVRLSASFQQTMLGALRRPDTQRPRSVRLGAGEVLRAGNAGERDSPDGRDNGRRTVPEHATGIARHIARRGHRHADDAPRRASVRLAG
jgi:hypothetical protein